MNDARRIRPADLLVLLAGSLLLVSPFLPWYGNRDGWSASTVLAILVALTAFLALGLFTALLVCSSPAKPIALSVWLVPVALIASLFALERLLAPPDGADRCYGAWVALAASLLALVGTWRSLADERPRREAQPVAEPPGR
ncbi:MAG: hypothetical protein NVSMB51_02340 [Solirubrobacteraceae bacterium]